MSNFSKVYFSKPNSTMEFATEEYLLSSLKGISAESHLPIDQLLTIIYNKQADTVSCSRDDTNYSFFARLNRGKVSVVIKKLGEKTVDFEIPLMKIEKII